MEVKKKENIELINQRREWFPITKKKKILLLITEEVRYVNEIL